MTRNQATIGYTSSDEVVAEFRPFNWPRNKWEVLKLVADRETGWRDLSAANAVKLNHLYGGAHGSVERGLKGNIVQYVEGTGHSPFLVRDWRGNIGVFAFVPDTGLELEEVHGTGSSSQEGFFTGTLTLAWLEDALAPTGIPSGEALGTPVVS